MSEQLQFSTLGGEVVSTPARGRHYIEPRGYAAKPGTGPAGETCKSCKHKVNMRRGRYPKCVLSRACWTATRRTDILAGAAACSKWEAAGE